MLYQFSYSSSSSHLTKLCCFPGCSVCNTSRGTSFLQTSGPAGAVGIWHVTCDVSVLLGGEGGREWWEVISDMPQLEGSNPEKTLPTWKKKKGSRFGAVCRLIFLCPLVDYQYTQFWLVPSNHPWEKKASRRLCPSFLLAERVIGLVFFSSASMCRFQMKTGLFSTGRRLQSHIACRVENWKSKTGSVRTLVLFCH